MKTKRVVVTRVVTRTSRHISSRVQRLIWLSNLPITPEVSYPWTKIRLITTFIKENDTTEDWWWTKWLYHLTSAGDQHSGFLIIPLQRFHHKDWILLGVGELAILMYFETLVAEGLYSFNNKGSIRALDCLGLDPGLFFGHPPGLTRCT